MCAMAMIPFALAFSLLAFRGGRRWTVGAAALSAALVVSNNLYGALALGLFFPVLVWSMHVSREPAGMVWRRAGAIVLLTAGLCAWWMTPSFVRLTARNLMLVALPGNRWSEFAGLLIALAFGAVSRWKRASAWSTFVAGSLLFFVLGTRTDMVPLSHHRRTLRFVPEFEIMVIIAAVEGLRRVWLMNRWAAVAVTALCFSFSTSYLAKPWSVYSPDPDYRRRVEYRMTEWIAQNLPGSRVFPFGSVSYWYTTWRDLPEVVGGSDQGMQTMMPALARYQLRLGEDPWRDVYWLQSLGADAVMFHDKNSEEIYHEVANPRKFMGVLPVIYDRNGDVVYRVPRRPGLARVVDEQRISHLHWIPWDNLDKEALQAYAETLEAIDAPANYARPALDEIRITATTGPGQSVLVQENYDPGWKAFVDGKGARIETDIMGFMRVRPEPGAHAIRFAYGMPLESRIGMWISVLSLLAVTGLLVTNRREKDSRSAPR